MPPEPARLAWKVVDDGVMGGLSEGHVEVLTQGIRFSGILSIENQGGFSSIRASVGSIPDNATGFRLVVTGDGRRYQFRLRETDHPGAPAWRAQFDTSGARETVDLALPDFEPVFRGQRVHHSRALDTGAMRFLGFMLASYRPGPFSLIVHDIEYRLEAGPDA